MMRMARVQAQAKVNLFLIVQDKRDDDYHDIVTEFQRIDLSDQVTVRVGGTKRTLDVAGPALPAAGLGAVERNLAFKAAEAFAAKTGGDFARGFAVELTKHIPVGAGLGGGSADAAAVLRAMNALAPTAFDQDALLEIAATLGSDVPFLASEYVRASGGGRGESLGDLSDWPPSFAPAPADVVIAVPSSGISTAEAYRWVDEDRLAGYPMPAMESEGGLTQASSYWHALRDYPGNTFESVVERRYPKLGQIRMRLLEAGAEMARLAGSGSCVFGIFLDRAPSAKDLGLDVPIIQTRTSARVVQVEVLQ